MATTLVLDSFALPGPELRVSCYRHRSALFPSSQMVHRQRIRAEILGCWWVMVDLEAMRGAVDRGWGDRHGAVRTRCSTDDSGADVLEVQTPDGTWHECEPNKVLRVSGSCHPAARMHCRLRIWVAYCDG
eukprot:171793-Rhodomonas_salina.1